jgi:hypothetical protein
MRRKVCYFMIAIMAAVGVSILVLCLLVTVLGNTAGSVVALVCAVPISWITGIAYLNIMYRRYGGS